MSYSDPPPPPPQYGAPQPPYGGMPQNHPRGVLVLVLGILGLVCCGFLSFPAFFLGRSALSEIDAAPPGTYSNRGMVKAGYICGLIGMILFVLGILVYIILVATGSGS